MQTRERCVGSFETAFAAADIDILACPAAISPPHHDVRAHQPELLLTDVSRPITTNPNGKFTVPYDYSGAPTITLPCGLTDGSVSTQASPTAT